MDRLSRKELKSDKFAQEVGHTVELLTENKEKLTKYGIIAAAVLVIAGGIFFYIRHQATLRADALANVLKIEDAVISATPQPPKMNFPTQEDKDKARLAGYSEVASKYNGSREGAIAQLYLAGAQLDKGKLDEAEKIYKTMIDSAPKDYAALARYSLGQLYAGQGKTADAEKMLRPLTEKSTTFVSKEQASLALAQALEQSNPAEAQKLLTALSTSKRTVISTNAISELGKLKGKQN